MIRTFVGLFLLLLACNQVQAAVYSLSGGQLVGATDVIVDGSFYNVDFFDGTCASLFDDCDSASDFTADESFANLASIALIEQIFSADDTYDFEPENTGGCGHSQLCFMVTPYGLNASNGEILSWYALNWHESQDSLDSAGEIFSSPLLPDSDSINVVYAKWTLVSSVPIPAPVWLFGTALIGLVGFSKRRKLA